MGHVPLPPFTSRPSASQLLYRYRRRTRRQGGGKEQPRRRGASGRLVADQECLRPVPELRHPAVRSSTDRPLVQETSEPGSERVYRLDGNDYFLHTRRRHQGVDRQRRVQAVFLLSADGLLLYPDQQSDRNHPGLSGRGQHHRQHCGPGRLGGMYVYRCQPVCDKGILERDILAESTDLSETAVANHAFCRVFRRIHQAVRPDDPSVCQYHGRTYDHPRPHLPDLYHGIDGVVGEFRNDDRFGAVLRVHELSGIAGGLSASIYIHIIVSQLYRFG